ncbi:MAG: S1/P1 nuclease [Bryobacteraceae bacterium]
MRKFLFVAALSLQLPAFGWGPEGHRLVARIAEQELTPKAKARIAAILGPGQSIAGIASWADEIRPSRPDTGPWHYVDIPLADRRLDMARDCPKGQCIVASLESFEAVLKDPRATPEERKEALLFVVHFVGDMHQPLHSIDNNDKGGNDVKVVFHGRPTNLHSVWDSGLLNHMPKEPELFPTLDQQAEQHRGKWSKGRVEDWIEQSHRLAQKITYGKLPKPGANGVIVLNAAYEKAADGVVTGQIEKAGVRLAAVLDACLR